MKNLKRFARRNKAVLTGDPDGLLATLQISRRLVNESLKAGEPITIRDAVDEAVKLSSPKDEARTWWAAVRVLLRNAEAGKSILNVLADACEAQGRMNAQIKKRVAA